MNASRRISLSLVILSLIVATTFGDDKKKQHADKPDPAILTLERIFSSSEFSSAGFNGRWQAEGATYEILEKSELTSGGKDIVQYDAATGARSVVVPASRLVPAGGTSPLAIDAYAWSKDRSLLLIYTNSKRVWRRNTRGDY